MLPHGSPGEAAISADEPRKRRTLLGQRVQPRPSRRSTLASRRGQGPKATVRARTAARSFRKPSIHDFSFGA